jgi:hypothetical protein
MEKIITIKSEDKAAFLNRMKKKGYPIDTYQEIEGNDDGEYSIVVTNPGELETINSILNQSPTINKVKLSSADTQKLKEYIRKKVQAVLAEARK